MALSRSLLAGHVLQSPAGQPRKRGQQRHLLCARDSARCRQRARSSPPPACPPPRGSLGPPAPHLHAPSRLPRSCHRKEKLESRGLREVHVRGGKPQPWGASTSSSPFTHIQAECAPEGQVLGRGRGHRLVISVPGRKGKVSRIHGSPRQLHPEDSKERSLAQRRGQGCPGEPRRKGPRT